MLCDNEALSIAVQHYRSNRLEQARRICHEILQEQPNHAVVLHLLGSLAIQDKNYDEAIHHLKKALETAPLFSIDSAGIFDAIGYAHYCQNNFEAAMPYFRLAENSTSYKSPNINIHDNCRLRLSLQKPGIIPGILITALVKSASSHILHVLATGLKIPDISVAGQNFPYDVVQPVKLQLLAKGAVARGHFGPTPQNLATLNGNWDKLIVHVRDPRQTALSRVHNINNLRAAGSYDCIFSMTPRPPENYLTLSFTDQISWYIENYIPLAVKWIEGWLDADEDPSFHTKIFFTQFEDFKKDPRAFFYQILRFYGIEKSLFNFENTTPSQGILRFRKGIIDEWREVFTLEQRKKSSQIISERLATKFGWTRSW